MAIFALYFFLLLVRTQQGKVGLCMVECLRIQHNDLRISSPVFGMAGTAFLFLKPTVESLVFQDIRFHFLVAIRAQFGLRFLVESDVTFITILFELGVPYYHLSRHQH